MRRVSLFGLLLVPALALLTLGTGCSEKKADVPSKGATTTGDKEKKDAGPKMIASRKGAVAQAEVKDGVVKGTVKFKGTPPKAVEIKNLVEHKDCTDSPDQEKVEQEWLIDANKGVANVVVFLEGASGKLQVTDAAKEAVKEPAVIDQPHCAFVPHVVALYPDGGQKLLVKNSAKVPHNTKMTDGGPKNPDSDNTISPGDSKELEIKHQTKALKLACSLHPWMNAKVKTLDTPYFAVTKADGSFEIRNVPSGEVKVFIWHEDVDAANKVEVELAK